MLKYWLIVEKGATIAAIGVDSWRKMMALDPPRLLVPAVLFDFIQIEDICHLCIWQWLSMIILFLWMTYIKVHAMWLG